MNVELVLPMYAPHPVFLFHVGPSNNFVCRGDGGRGVVRGLFRYLYYVNLIRFKFTKKGPGIHPQPIIFFYIRACNVQFKCKIYSVNVPFHLKAKSDNNLPEEI